MAGTPVPPEVLGPGGISKDQALEAVKKRARKGAHLEFSVGQALLLEVLDDDSFDSSEAPEKPVSRHVICAWVVTSKDKDNPIPGGTTLFYVDRKTGKVAHQTGFF
jgi:hypothetical protein